MRRGIGDEALRGHQLQLASRLPSLKLKDISSRMARSFPKRLSMRAMYFCPTPFPRKKNALVLFRSHLLVYAATCGKSLIPALRLNLSSFSRHADLALRLQEERSANGNAILGGHGRHALHLERGKLLRPGGILQCCFLVFNNHFLLWRDRDDRVWLLLSIKEAMLKGRKRGSTRRWRNRSSNRAVLAAVWL